MENLNLNLVKVLDNTGANVLLTKALDADKHEAERILKTFEVSWNLGESFTPIAMLENKQRTPETETAEMEAMLTQVKQMLEAIVIKKWASCLTREQALAVCNAMVGLMFDTRIVSDETGISLQAHTIVRAWNEAHPDEEKIISTPGFEI